MPDRTGREWAVLFARVAFRFLVVGAAASAGAVVTHEVNEIRSAEDRAESAADAHKVRVQMIRELRTIIARLDALELSCPEPVVVCEPPQLPRQICVCAKANEYGCLASPNADTWTED